MTANEMKFAFQLKFDSLFEFSAPAYDDRHISYLLTEAQFRIFLARYNPLANKFQKGFEGDEQRRRDLQQLVHSVTIDKTASTILFNGTTGSTTLTRSNGTTTDRLAIGEVITLTGKVAGNTASITSINEDTVTIDKPLIADLSNTTVNVTLGSSSRQNDKHTNGVVLTIPKFFLYAIEEGATLTGLSYESWVKPVKHDEYMANINNPYKKPYNNLIWRMDLGNSANIPSDSNFHKRVELILPSGATLSKYRLRYLSYPPSIVCNEFDNDSQINCVLDEVLHREIVDEAVAIAQAAVKEEKYQIGRAEANISE